jgi:hypothetical protein
VTLEFGTRTPSPLGAVARGLVAGVVGTAAMTAWQELSGRLESSGKSGGQGEGDGTGDPWEGAPAPAVVARRVLEGVFRQEVSAERIPLLTHLMHWGYGTGWGVAYGLLQGTVRANPLVHGALFGTGVWAASYLQLVPMGIYEPPWEYPPETLALDLSYHLVYGVATAAAYDAIA